MSEPGEEAFIFQAPMNLWTIAVNLELQGSERRSNLLYSEGCTICSLEKAHHNSNSGEELCCGAETNNVVDISTKFNVQWQFSIKIDVVFFFHEHDIGILRCQFSTDGDPCKLFPDFWAELEKVVEARFSCHGSDQIVV